MDAPIDLLTTDGAWCWFQDPRAVRYVDDRDRTYVGWISRAGDVQVAALDHDDGTADRTTLHAGFERDDHDAPSLYVGPDGRLVVFYTLHSGPDIRYRIGSRPESIEEFGDERVIAPSTDHTYPNPYHLADRDRTYLFYRNANRNLAYVASEDGCESWSPERELVVTEGWSGVEDAWVYFKLDGNGTDRIDVGVTHYEYARSTGSYRDVRHLAFDGSTCRTAAGDVLGDVEDGPIGFRDPPAVYDTAATKTYAWIWDCVTHPDGPALAYAELRNNDEHHYRYARWTGNRWIETRLTAGGRNIKDQLTGAYSGGVVLDHERPGVCYLSIGDNDGSRIERWETDDGGRRWTVSRLTDERVQNVRPVVPRNRHDELSVVWMRGRYDDYLDGAYETAIAAPGTGW